ncbi:integrating conjugative element protein [Serratia fonticola]|uniref:integrating conjugative element protein n=1 Tax=Serratia fonticola TaxID=47917 RepID=UPI00192B3F3F|nr:integrating conjugative element protein [Serratia fonticola]MBL5862111.1 integrating conjugative element protein [Serratia fonticola]
MNIQSCRSCLILALLLSHPVFAAPPLIVVEDRGGTPAQPYYEALDPQTDTAPTNPTQSPLSRNTQYSEADMLPVRSTLLTPGTVTPRAIQAPGLSPLFIVGDDPLSHAWLKQHRERLRAIHATGLVVQIDSLAALEALRRIAPELTLAPVSGDELAQRLGLRHYPALITATGIEH